MRGTAGEGQPRAAYRPGRQRPATSTLQRGPSCRPTVRNLVAGGPPCQPSHATGPTCQVASVPTRQPPGQYPQATPTRRYGKAAAKSAPFDPTDSLHHAAHHADANRRAGWSDRFRPQRSATDQRTRAPHQINGGGTQLAGLQVGQPSKPILVVVEGWWPGARRQRQSGAHTGHLRGHTATRAVRESAPKPIHPPCASSDQHDVRHGGHAAHQVVSQRRSAARWCPIR